MQNTGDRPGVRQQNTQSVSHQVQVPKLKYTAAQSLMEEGLFYHLRQIDPEYFATVHSTSNQASSKTLRDNPEANTVSWTFFSISKLWNMFCICKIIQSNVAMWGLKYSSTNINCQQNAGKDDKTRSRPILYSFSCHTPVGELTTQITA